MSPRCHQVLALTRLCCVVHPQTMYHGRTYKTSLCGPPPNNVPWKEDSSHMLHALLVTNEKKQSWLHQLDPGAPGAPFASAFAPPMQGQPALEAQSQPCRQSLLCCPSQPNWGGIGVTHVCEARISKHVCKARISKPWCKSGERISYASYQSSSGCLSGWLLHQRQWSDVHTSHLLTPSKLTGTGPKARGGRLRGCIRQDQADCPS